MRKKLFVYLCAIGFALAIVNNASATLIEDQTSEYGYCGFNVDPSALNWQQEVRVGVGGLLSSIDLYVTMPGTVDFYINTGSGWQTDSNDFFHAGLSLPSSGWNSIDVSSAGILLDAGDTFVIGLQGIGGRLCVSGSQSPDRYKNGLLYLKIYDSFLDYSNSDLAFKTNMDTSYASTPLPAAFLLFGTGIVGLAGIRSRKKK